MNPNQPNPHHKPETSSNANTQTFHCESVKPGSEEFKARELFHNDRRLKESKSDGYDESQKS